MNEDEKLIKNEYETANIFNTFFSEIVPDHDTKLDERYLFLTQLKKLYKNIKIIRLSLSPKNGIDKNNTFSFGAYFLKDIAPNTAS